MHDVEQLKAIMTTMSRKKIEQIGDVLYDGGVHFDGAPYSFLLRIKLRYAPNNTSYLADYDIVYVGDKAMNWPVHPNLKSVPVQTTQEVKEIGEDLVVRMRMSFDSIDQLLSRRMR